MCFSSLKIGRTGQAKTAAEFEPLPAFVVLVIAMHSSYWIRNRWLFGGSQRFRSRDSPWIPRNAECPIGQQLVSHSSVNSIETANTCKNLETESEVNRSWRLPYLNSTVNVAWQRRSGLNSTIPCLPSLPR